VGALLILLAALAVPGPLWAKAKKHKPKGKAPAAESESPKLKAKARKTPAPSPVADNGPRRSTLRVFGGSADAYDSRAFGRFGSTGVAGSTTGSDLSRGAALGATLRFARDTDILGWTLDFRRSLQDAGAGEDAWIEMTQLGLGGEALWRLGRLDLTLGLGLASAQDRVWRGGATPKDYHGWSSLARGTLGLAWWMGAEPGHGFALSLCYDTARGSSSFDADPGYEMRPSLLMLGLSMND
jgi:hypothetical protein